jgi:hypothetical protein
MKIIPHQLSTFSLLSSEEQKNVLKIKTSPISWYSEDGEVAMTWSDKGGKS